VIKSSPPPSSVTWKEVKPFPDLTRRGISGQTDVASGRRLLYRTVHSFSFPPVFICLSPSLFPFMCLDDLVIHFFSHLFPLLSPNPHFLIFLVSYFITYLRHCATSRKVAGSVPDRVTGIFHFLLPFRPHYGPGVESASNRNEYQGYLLGGGEGKGCRCVGLITLPPSRGKCLEILGASTSWSPKGLHRPAVG